jgi:uncharacterized protein YodC (DUF2158 family)
MSEQLKIGDRVILKSGGGVMTIEDISENDIKCVWFDSQKHLVERKFKPVMLKSKFGSWYNEIDGSCKAKDQEEAPYKGSTVERFMFNLSVLTTILFCVITSIPSLWPCRKFHFQFLFLLIPLAIWMFLRCSRKDMSATAYLIAGLFGAFGGALVVILQSYL